jgi:hypothetical protein
MTIVAENLYLKEINVRVVKSRRLRWVGHI